MIPTSYLRQVPIRQIFGADGQTCTAVTGYRLQQWWSIHGVPPGQATEYAPHGSGLPGASMNMGEWRDVEIVEAP